MAADSEYWKALILFLFDSGTRISESMSLLWRDLTFTVDGIKTSMRNIKIRAASRPVILGWLDWQTDCRPIIN